MVSRKQGEAGIEFLRNIVNAIKVDPGLSVLQSLHQNYDLVSWDPRGIGLALPSANCNISALSGNSQSSPSTNLSLTPVKKRSLDKIYGPEGLEFKFTPEMERSFNRSAQCQAQISGVDGIGPQYVQSTTNIVVCLCLDFLENDF